ncbi:hypothetical protein [Pseudonocardia sp. NPDC049154]|uniref:hypothetical protein n=1 Tax=Pseudonocardia sp. NPDC049154 TaxID=3155501 RepID=UPI0033E95CA5
MYLKRTLMTWVLWIAAYVINNGLVAWLPTHYSQVFELPLQTSLLYGWITSAVGVVASIICALYIDKSAASAGTPSRSARHSPAGRVHGARRDHRHAGRHPAAEQCR